MKRGKAYIDFNTIKEVFNLPEDALLKQFIISPLEDVVEIEFYSNEGTVEANHVGNIRRERLVKPDNIVFKVFKVNLNTENLEGFSVLLREYMKNIQRGLA